MTWHSAYKVAELLVTEKVGKVQEIDGIFIFPNVSNMSVSLSTLLLIVSNYQWARQLAYFNSYSLPKSVL